MNTKSINEVYIKIYRYFGVSVSQKLFFVQHLSVMLKAGISLNKALSTLTKQATDPLLQEIVADLASSVEKGQPFSSALKRHPKIFNEFFVNMVESGELTGKLEQVLNRLYLQMKKDHELISKVKGAMVYPTIVIIAMVGVAIGMITFVIPKISQMFKEINATLPIATRILIGISDLVVNHGIIVSLTVLALGYGFFKFIKHPRGKILWHGFLLKVPIASAVIKKVNLARFSRTLSALLVTDIPISKTLLTAGTVLNNQIYRRHLTSAAGQIEKGVVLSAILETDPDLFPATVIQMIKVGEQTGSMDTIMNEIASFYEEEVNTFMGSISTIIEPLLILVLGAGVAFMAIAVIMPIYSLSQQV